jgi:16S rRNA processing protein RimM
VTVSGTRQRRILLGEITGVHGIRGDVLVRSYTGEPGAIASYGPLMDAAGTRSLSLSVVRKTDKGIVAHIAGIDDRTTAERLRGTKLYVERALLPPAEAFEFYHADLIGLKAIAPNGESLGTIVSVQNFGAGDLLELQPETGTPTELIPFQDQWVPNIDLDAGIVTIDRPPESGDDSDNNGEESHIVSDDD